MPAKRKRAKKKKPRARARAKAKQKPSKPRKVGLSGIEGSRISYVLSSPEDYDAVLESVFRALFPKGSKSSCIYLSVVKPHSSMEEFLEQRKIRASPVYYIDCASSIGQGEKRVSERVILVDPQNLTGMAIAVSELVRSIPGKKVLVVDSVPALLVYNGRLQVERLTHFLLQELKASGTQGVLLSPRKDSRPLFEVLSRLCDKTFIV